jgi:hypothetical protein
LFSPSTFHGGLNLCLVLGLDLSIVLGNGCINNGFFVNFSCGSRCFLLRSVDSDINCSFEIFLMLLDQLLLQSSEFICMVLVESCPFLC